MTYTPSDFNGSAELIELIRSIDPIYDEKPKRVVFSFVRALKKAGRPELLKNNDKAYKHWVWSMTNSLLYITGLLKPERALVYTATQLDRDILTQDIQAWLKIIQ